MSKAPFDPQEELDTEVASPAVRGRKRSSGGWVWKAAAAFLMSFVACTVFFYLYLQYSPLPPNNITNTSKLVASDGQVITDLVSGGENRLKIALKDVPKTLIEATLAVEDQQFYNHAGINPAGIARALWVDIKSGEVREGGSTITQQLAKNLYLNQDRTLSRKLKEAMHTLQLELNYTKDEILEQYLNVIYYGQGAYGIEMAAQTYFNKPAKDLTLAESAMLAGLPKAPSIYNPFLNFDAAKERQRVVLSLMVSEGVITQEQMQQAFQEPLNLAPLKNPSGQAPYFSDFVSWQLKNSYEVAEEELYRGGLKVTTTLDLNMQKAAESIVAKYLKDQDPKLQVSLLAMDPNTGEIKAMVGGRNYAASTYNRTLAKRQPGSSFKPLVYLTALNNKYTPATRIMSEKTTFNYEDDNGDLKAYEVHNFANVYANDHLSFRDAIARSDNVFAVTTIMDIGPEKVINTAKALGIESEMKPYPSLALGTFPVSSLELVKSYAPLANGGYKVEPHAIKNIENTAKHEVRTFDYEKKSLLDPGVTYILTDMMKAVYDDPYGTGHRVKKLFGRTAAGKTGTTDTDAWMVGYTPNLLTAVWIGYDRDTFLSPTESHLAAPIWADFMEAAHKDLPKKDFTKPSNLVEAYIDPKTGQLATENCPAKRREYFLKGSEPVDWCETHPSLPSTIKNVEQKTESKLKSFWNWVTGHEKKE